MPPASRSAPDIQPGDETANSPWLADFARMAASSPHRIAVVSDGSSIRFGELNARSNQIARLLRDSGTGPGNFIGVGYDRSVELIVALLGILKSGAAYIPLDPSYPAARISKMISTAGLKTILTDKANADLFRGAEVICPDALSLSLHPTDDVMFTGEPDSPIYAIFTSGSTGEPKAASVRHGGFNNLLQWYRTELKLNRRDRTLAISSPSFDLTQKNLFSPLVTGGTLILDDCRTYDITRILGLIREHAVTIINCTPSSFYPLLDAAAADDFQALRSLRFAILGGEPISLPRLRAWLECPATRAEVMNSYGPTECTDICLFHRLHRGNLDNFPSVPLGREIPNVSVSIRDEGLEILSDGVLGELCISGAGVGDGYLNDPAGSSDRFLTSDKRIYRSGDLGKRLPCGNFEFHGRTDQQVKVNGHRIELNEIELALALHEEVLEAVVRSDGGRLVAHIRGKASPETLRSHLGSQLPSYMIPGEYRYVDAFPLTPNGKTDRKALASNENPKRTHESAASGLESHILHLWSEILGRPISNPCGNFFDLGGNSIHIAIVHVRLREMTGIDFPIIDLFTRPSARSIAKHLSPDTASPAISPALDRARMTKAGFAAFRRHSTR